MKRKQQKQCSTIWKKAKQAVMIGLFGLAALCVIVSFQGNVYQGIFAIVVAIVLSMWALLLKD